MDPSRGPHVFIDAPYRRPPWEPAPRGRFAQDNGGAARFLVAAGRHDVGPAVVQAGRHCVAEQVALPDSRVRVPVVRVQRGREAERRGRRPGHPPYALPRQADRGFRAAGGGRSRNGERRRLDARAAAPGSGRLLVLCRHNADRERAAPVQAVALLLRTEIEEQVPRVQRRHQGVACHQIQPQARRLLTQRHLPALRLLGLPGRQRPRLRLVEGEPLRRDEGRIEGELLAGERVHLNGPGALAPKVAGAEAQVYVPGPSADAPTVEHPIVEFGLERRRADVGDHVGLPVNEAHVRPVVGQRPGP